MDGEEGGNMMSNTTYNTNINMDGSEQKGQRGHIIIDTHSRVTNKQTFSH